MYPVRSRKKAAMASHYAWVLLRPISPHLSRGQRCISYYYFQTFAYQCRFASPVRPDCVCFSVFFPQPRQLNANDQEWIIGQPMKASAGNRAYMQSLISLALSICRIFPIDDSIGDALLGFPDRHYFFSFSDIKPHGLDESFSRFFGFYLLRVFLRDTISQYSLKGI